MNLHPAPPRSQRGSTLVLVALLLPVVLGLMAMAVDLARVVLVKHELRRAAEAGALAGANGLLTNSAPDWSSAAQRARTTVFANRADGNLLQAADVRYGYWNLATSGLNSSGSFVEGTSRPLGGSWAPALKVTVARDSSANGLTNGGPLALFLAPVFGTLLQTTSSSAIAMQSAPGYALPGALFPTAINQCMFNLYWNATTGTPIPVSPSSPYYNPSHPYELRIGSLNQYGTCNSGQWTLFSTTDNSTPAVRNLLTNGNPTGLSVGSPTYIDTGTKTTLYSSVIYPKTYLVPVVGNVSQGFQAIVAFAPFRVTNSVGGSTKAIFGQFVPLSEFPGGTEPGGSTYYGTPAPPALVQ
ncbi:MAG: pilus assembly protein TadE [Betaproteobacteria bacterium]|nr:pilus assembly protein TadE [Betaproteobacteria bacterium]NCU94467.1 pilus assembly protein TadE [Betaproteobacteria bacterium]